ncbi:MAG: hypothetical protein ACOYB3_11005 [Azonexus sp.]
MTKHETTRVILALQELDRAERMHQRGHPELVAESAQIARDILAALLQDAGVNLDDLAE